MNKFVSPKITALTFGILVISFAVASYVVAWQEPTQAPPEGNIATPLNIGPTGQSKEGGLILNTGGAENALIINKGKICIGTDCRDKWPETGIIITYDMTAITDYNEGSKTYYSNTVTYECPIDTNIVWISRPPGTVTIGRIDPPSDYPQYGNGCSYSADKNKASVTARVYTCTRAASGDNRLFCDLTDACTPGSDGYWTTTCQGFTCNSQFQCGQVVTVGQ